MKRIHGNLGMRSNLGTLGRSLFRLRNLAGATALATTLFAFPALAQDSAADEANSNDIIVTAQRRSEKLEDVPMTVAALSSQNLESAGVASLRDIARVVTGVSLAQAGGFPQPAIRGVTTLTNGPSFENNVAIYIDGFYQASAQEINIDLPNVDSIQVLKGPQGTLYGRNATGGAILIYTIRPSDEWKGKAELTYARFDDKRASAYVAGPLGEKVGVSLAGYIRRSDGYIKLVDRVTPGKLNGNGAPLEQDSVRLKFTADLSEAFSATLGYNYTHVRDPRGQLFSTIENVPSSLNTPTRVTQLGTVAWDYGTQVDTKSHQGQLTLSLDTGIGTLNSYTGYSNLLITSSFDFDGSYVNTGWSSGRTRQKTFQQAVDFTIDAVKGLDLIIGGTYFRDKLYYDPFGAATSWILTPGVPAPSTATPPPLSSLTAFQNTQFQQIKKAWALYADATFHVTDALSINAGARYSEETQDVFAQTFRPLTNTFSFPPTSKPSKFSKFTPRASIRYEVGPRTNIYASYSKGFRSGAWNAALPPLPAQWLPAKQEEVDAFEAGFKTAGSNFRLEFAGFYYDYKDLQVGVTTRDPTCGADPTCARVVTLTANAPEAKIYGLEGSFEFEPTENFKIRGGAAWLHARYGAFPNATGTGVNPAAVGINVNTDPLKTYLNVTQTQDWTGLQMSRSPNFTANLGLEYNIPNGEGGIRMSTNVNYTDSYVVTNPSTWGPLAGSRASEQRFRQSAYALVSAQITWTHPSGHYYIQAYGNNLTDHKYKLHYTGTSTFGSYAPMAEPLTFGGRVGYKF